MSWKEEIIKRRTHYSIKRPNNKWPKRPNIEDRVSKRLQMAANELYEIMKNELTGNEPFEALEALEEMFFDPQYRADR